MRSAALALVATLAACSPEAAPQPSENGMHRSPIEDPGGGTADSIRRRVEEPPVGDVGGGVRPSAKEEKFVMDKEALKKRLTPLQYEVCVFKGTERPFQNKYWNFKGEGKYHCLVCEAVLFDSKTKFDSGTGWPSFYDVLTKGNVKSERDLSHGMERIEVTCAKCGSHLGHLFDDGPPPTGQRYCINSAALEFRGEEPKK